MHIRTYIYTCVCVCVCVCVCLCVHVCVYVCVSTRALHCMGNSAGTSTDGADPESSYLDPELISWQASFGNVTHVVLVTEKRFKVS